MIEPYQWLCTHADTLGIAPSAIGPASADLRLSGLLKEWRGRRARIRWTLRRRPRRGSWPPASIDHDLDLGETLCFRPGYFYLASTREIIRVPPTHCAMIHMRSSLARRGLGHKMAGFIDPGFTGQVTLELETSIPMDVTIGERIVQITYHRLTEPTTQPYRGQYQGQMGPTEAYHVTKEV